MYLQLLCCWFRKRKSLFVLILWKLVYESLLLFFDIMLVEKKVEKKVEKNGILLKKQIAGTFLYMDQLFSVVSLFSKIKWNSFQFQTLLLLFRLVERLVKINYVKSYEFTSEDQQTVAQLKDFTEKNKVSLNN